MLVPQCGTSLGTSCFCFSSAQARPAIPTQVAPCHTHCPGPGSLGLGVPGLCKVTPVSTLRGFFVLFAVVSRPPPAASFSLCDL